MKDTNTTVPQLIKTYTDGSHRYRVGSLSVRAWPGCKCKVYRGRKVVGTFWISVPNYVLLTVGEDLAHNAECAAEAANDA